MELFFSGSKKDFILHNFRPICITEFVIFANKTVNLRSNCGWKQQLKLCSLCCRKKEIPLSDALALPASVCKFVSIEMKSAFEETGKTKAVIESNYNFIDGKGAPPVKYVKS